MKNRKKLTALLSKNGTLRIPKELVPEGVKGFHLRPHHSGKQLELTPLFGGEKNGTGMRRKAMFSNTAARSPWVCVLAALRFLEVKPAAKTMEFPIRRKGGSLVVTF